MAEYDDTNKGAAFAPFDDMELLLQGNVDNGGRSTKLAIIRRTSREGKEIMEIYEKIGAIFPNDNDKKGAPDYTGSIYKTDDKQSPWTNPNHNKRLAGWRKIKGDKPYMSFAISDPQNKTPF